MDVGKDLELGSHTNVVPVGRQAVRDVAVFYLLWLEGLDHSVLFAHPPDPMVTLDRHVSASGDGETVSSTGRIRA